MGDMCAVPFKYIQYYLNSVNYRVCENKKLMHPMRMQELFVVAILLPVFETMQTVPVRFKCLSAELSSTDGVRSAAVRDVLELSKLF